MGDISRITIGETTYDFKDTEARQAIADIGNPTDFLGVTTTEISEGSTVKNIVVDGETIAAKPGNIVSYGNAEFIFNKLEKWQEFGDLSGLGSLAYKSTAKTNYAPAGTVSQPTTTVTTNTTTINSMTGVGTLPSLTVSGETLVFSAGTLPTRGENTTVVTSLGTVTTSQPTFTGTQTEIEVS